MITLPVKVQNSSSLNWHVPSAGPEPETTENIIRGHADEMPVWLTRFVERVIELAELPYVDPQGSRPMDPQDVHDAMVFLASVMRDETEVPWIGRLNSGGVMLNWERSGISVEAIFDRNRGERQVMVELDGQEIDLPVERAGPIFERIVDRLALPLR